MWTMARIPDDERKTGSRAINDALDAALGLHGWTWSMAAAEMLWDRPQMCRARTGLEAFDLVRLLRLPPDIYEDFQVELIVRRRVNGGARFFGRLLGVLAGTVLASRGLAHEVWAAVSESRKEVTVA
jgi:hypothetical protein